MTPLGKGYESKNGIRVLDRVVVDSPEPKLMVGNFSSPSQQKENRTIAKTKEKILCVVYTEGVQYRLPLISDTWGWKCDGFFAASTQTITDPNAGQRNTVQRLHCTVPTRSANLGPWALALSLVP